MRSIRFDVQGFHRTYWDFFVGAGFPAGIFYLFAILAWQLGGPGRDAGAHARHGVGVHPFLCRDHGCELDVPLCHTGRILARDYRVFDRGGNPFCEWPYRTMSGLRVV